MAYDYKEAIKEDIRQYINDEIELSEYTADELKEKLEDTLWVSDGVTGNASGSYTFNSWKAKEYVESGGLDIIREMALEGWFDKETLWERFTNEEYEYLDVSIRCYLLNGAIDEVVDELMEE